MTAPRGEPEPESQPATDPTGPLPATTSGGPVAVRCQGCGHPLGTLRSTGTGRGWEADWTGARAVHGALSGTAGPACLNGRTGVVGETGWITVECQHCHRIWQGGDTYLQDLPGGAVDGAVHLGQGPHRGG